MTIFIKHSSILNTFMNSFMNIYWFAIYNKENILKLNLFSIRIMLVVQPLIMT